MFQPGVPKLFEEQVALHFERAAIEFIRENLGDDQKKVFTGIRRLFGKNFGEDQRKGENFGKDQRKGFGIHAVFYKSSVKLNFCLSCDQSKAEITFYAAHEMQFGQPWFKQCCFTYSFTDSIVFDANLIAIGSCLSEKIFHSTQLRLQKLVFFLKNNQQSGAFVDLSVALWFTFWSLSRCSKSVLVVRYTLGVGL